MDVCFTPLVPMAKKPFTVHRTVPACTYILILPNAPMTPRIRRPISSMAHPLLRHCSITSTECEMVDHTRLAPSVLSKGDATSSLWSVPSRYPSSGNHLVTGPCHKLPVRTNVTQRSNISGAWQRTRILQRNAERNSLHTQKCVILPRC